VEILLLGVGDNEELVVGEEDTMLEGVVG